MSLWPDAFKLANYVCNQSPMAYLMNMTLFEAFLGKEPDLMMLSEFGKAMLVWVSDMEHRKLDAQVPATQC